MKSTPPNQFDEQLDAQTSSPEATLLAQERQESLLAQIANLSSNQQEVLRLKFHGGLSYQEIADVTGLTKTNVGFLLHAAISTCDIASPPTTNVAGTLCRAVHSKRMASMQMGGRHDRECLLRLVREHS